MLKKIFIVLAFVLAMGTAAYCYEPLNTNADVSLEIKYKYEDINISGAEFKLYKVADVSSDVYYTVTEQFSKYAVSFSDMRSDGGRALAQTLKAYADRDDITPFATGVTDKDGVTKFPGLKTGLYLAASDTYKYNGYNYTPEPFLVCLPNYEDEKWVNDVTASPKVSREKVPSSGGGNPPSSSEPKTDIGVLKAWEDDDEATRPNSIEVQLLRNGMVFHTAVLNKDNNWHYTWEDVPDYGDYEVTEKTVPDGYTVSITREGDAFVVKNTGNKVESEPTTEAPTEAVTEEPAEEETKPGGDITPQRPSGGTPVINEPVIPDAPEVTTEDPYGTASGRGGRTNASTSRNGSGDDDTPNVPGLPGGGSGTGSSAGGSGGNGLPQTGQLKWPVPIMASAGCILFLLGFIRHKEEDLKLSKNN